MEKQMKLLTCLTKPIVLFVLLFAMGVGESWADMYLAGTMNSWAQTDATKFVDNKIEVTLAAETTYEFKIVDSGKWRSFDGSFSNTSLNYVLDKENVDGYNISITTGEAGTYIFQYSWYDSKHHLSVYYPQSRLKKNTVLYFDGRNSTKGWGTYTWGARFFYKYYDSGGDHSSLDCTSAVEDYVHYTTVPNHDYLGQIQVERKDPNNMDGPRWNYAAVCCAYNRANSGQNCMAISDDNKGWDDNFTPIWTTYCPPISSVTMTDNGSTLYGGNGSAGTPYLIEAGDPIKVHVTEAVSAVNDGNMTVNYQFKDGASNIGSEGTTSSATKTSGSSGTTHTIIVEARNKYNGAAGTLARCTLYYETKTVYTGLSVAKSGDDSKASAPTISQTWAIATNSVTVTATVPDGYRFTGWTSSNGSFGDATALSTTFTPTADNAVATATYALRWAISTSYDEWSTNDHIIGNISTSAGVTSGYVDITLPANTDYELKVFDKTNHWLGHTTSGVTLTYSNSGTKYAMAEGNYNLGFTTAGAGSYRFTWDITNSKVSVTYPTSYYVTAAGNPAAGGTVTPSSATYMSTSVGGEITATPNYSHYFNGWTSSADGTFTSASSATTTFKPASAAATVTAAFAERTAFIEGNFQIYNSTRATRTKTGNSWQDTSTEIKMTYDSENNRYYLHTYSTPAELAEQLNSADAYFYVKTSTSSSSIADAATYKAYASAYQSLATYGSSNKQPTGTSEHSFKFTGSEDGYVILYFNGTHVWYELECALSYYGGDGATGDAPAARTYYAYNATPKAASNTYSKTGYTFDHWDTASDDGGTDYDPNDDVTMNVREVCLHAQWTAKDYTINLANMEATTAGTTSVDVTFDASTNMTASDPITKPTKTHYDFGGYWTSENTGATLDHQLIGTDGKWIKDVEGYTSHDGSGNPTWVHDYAISLYAKWTEHEYTITTAVSPAGAGSISVGSSTTAKYVTSSGDITATANAGWVFKEWQFSKTGEDYDVYVSDGETYGSTSNPIQILAEHDGTLTAVFEPRYYLVGKIWDDSADGGMPGWANYNKPFKVVTTSPVLDTCKLTLSTNTSFYIMVRDKADGYSYGKSEETLEDNETVTFTDKDNKVMFYSNGGTNYTFKITGVDGSGRPTVSVERPHQMHFAHKRVDIDGNDHNDDLGGTLTATINGESAAHEQWFDYGSDVDWTATAETGYSLTWYTDNAYSNAMNPQPDASWSDPDITHDENIFAKFTEKATTVTLANDGHGKIQIDGVDKTETTVGVTTTRELTAVPNEGYKFSSWSKSGDDITLSSSSTNPTTLSGNGSGATSGQTVTANFVERYSIKGTMNGENWGTTHTLSNIGTNASSKDTCYVTMTLPANTTYEFAIYDEQTKDWYKAGTDAVYNMTYTNHTNWEFGDTKTYNCGITTAGEGTYKFIFNITDKTMTVTYPNSYKVNLGMKAFSYEGTEQGEVACTVTAVDGSSVNYANGSYIARGATVTIEASSIPAGYHFVGWHSSDSYDYQFAVDNPTSWTVSGNVNAYAKITEDTNTFEGDVEGHLTEWNQTGNWSAGHVPTANEVVILPKPVSVEIAHAVAKRIVIDQNSKTGKLTIQANKGLEVAGTITRTTDGSNRLATRAEDLILESSSAGNASLIFNNSNSCQATVQMYSIGDIDGDTWNWQFMGTPFTSANALYSYYGSYLYEWKAGGYWDAVANGGTMTPFTGYCITQDDPTYYVMDGTLNPTSSDKEISIPADLEFVMANSWTAPISVCNFTETTLPLTNKTIYLYNTGYTPDPENPASAGTGAGTYVAMPINSAVYTGNYLIAPMEGFYVDNRSGSAATITLKYDELVRPSGSHTDIVAGAMHAPKRVAAENEPAVMKIKATGSRYSERIVILEREDFSTGFDNGWDGKNLNEPGVAPILYALRADGTKDAVSAIPAYEGTVVGFRKGEDSQYTFSFEYDGDETLYLNDLKEQTSTLIDAVYTYTFSTESSDNETRFIISATPIQQVPTGIYNGGLLNDEMVKVRKIIINDQLFIIRAGRMYNAVGTLVK